MKIATWNINSVRLREPIVLKFLEAEAPDVLCLQETKSPVEKLPLENFAALGYTHVEARGFKGYNGVMTLSKLPFVESYSRNFVGREDARHIATRFENGVTLHNFYVPAGGDEPDRDVNEKFGHKLDFLSEMSSMFEDDAPNKAVLVGDLNIAPLEDDVWSHKQLLKVVSHTPIECETLDKLMQAGGWRDVVRALMPEGKLYSWWSYRARDWDAADKGRRLDHVWASADLADSAQNVKILREARGWEKPSDHVPVIVEFAL